MALPSERREQGSAVRGSSEGLYLDKAGEDGAEMGILSEYLKELGESTTRCLGKRSE